MSHQPERKEKNCLNCGTEVVGRFCHVCGQENIVTHQGFWSLAKHFVYDVLHFDGKFFHTLGYLFTRPGFVARQYSQGQRMRYLDPIRMYLFTSAVFFLIFFSFGNLDFKKQEASPELTMNDRREMAADFQERAARNPADSLLLQKIPVLLDSTKTVDPDSPGIRNELSFSGQESARTVAEYDSVQASLPTDQRDGWLERQLTRKAIKSKKQHGGMKKVGLVLIDTFAHQLPYLLFVSLPFFALILKLLYHRRKQFFYSDHAVFTLYHYIFSFLLMLVLLGITGLRRLTHWEIFRYVMLLVVLSWPVFLFIEMKNFYRQRMGKTVVKFLLLNFAGFFVLLLLFILFLLLSFFKL